MPLPQTGQIIKILTLLILNWLTYLPSMKNMVRRWNYCKTQLGKYVPIAADALEIAAPTGCAVNLKQVY